MLGDDSDDGWVGELGCAGGVVQGEVGLVLVLVEDSMVAHGFFWICD